MKTIKMKDCGFEDHKVGDSGIFHAIAEAFTVASMEKSWDNIISVGVDSETNEGIVKYKDSVFADNKSVKDDVMLGAIHLFTYFASEILAICYVEKMTSKEDYLDYVFANMNELTKDKESIDSEDRVMLSVMLPMAKYLPFIFASANKLAYSRGRSLLGTTLKELFNEMGCKFDSEEEGV